MCARGWFTDESEVETREEREKEDEGEEMDGENRTVCSVTVNAGRNEEGLC